MKTMFSVPGSLVIVTAICIAIAAHYAANPFGFALFVSLGWFVYGKPAFTMSLCQGYGVKQGVKMMFGMPAVIAVFITAITFVTVYLLQLAYEPSTLHPQTIANFRAFGWCVMSGVVTAILHWFFYARDAYFHESEYNIRVLGKEVGATPEDVEETLTAARRFRIVR